MNVYDIVPIFDDYRNNKQYNGTEPKFGIRLDGTDYIVKEQRDNWNNVYSEYIASNCILILGGISHETFLGNYKNKDVVLCKDFNISTQCLKSFNNVDSMSLDTLPDRHDYYYDDVLYLFSKLKGCNVEDCALRFNQMYIFDALFGNPDRHKGNWGVLKTQSGYAFAPIFDNGACLFPRALNVSISEDWMRARVYTFPNSKVMFDNVRERSSYYEILNNERIFDDIVASITYDKILLLFTFIETTNISDYLKTLYKTVIYYRYKCVLKREPFVWEGTK